LTGPGVLSAQNNWATFSGEVTDVTRAGIPGAHVVLEPQAGDRPVQESLTNAQGSYSIPLVEPGTYTVRVSAAGFRDNVRQNVPATAGEVLRLPVSLEVGSFNDSLVVSAPMDLIQTENASRSSVLDSIQIEAFPLLGRQVYNVLSLSPGVLFAQEEFGTSGYSGVRNWDLDGKYIINGGLPGTNQFLLNGAPVSLTGQWQFTPGVDAVDEVQVLTNTYDAQYGRTGGGTVLTTLRNGGNQWHGGAYEFLRNAALDANSFDNNLIGLDRGKHIAHQYGGTLSGPLRANRDFVFFSSDNDWEVAPSPIVSNTPPLALRDGQHFTVFKINVYDPATTHACSGPDCLAPYVRNPFPGNVIPPSRLSPIGRAILALYPAPNARGITQNFNAAGNEGHFKYLQPIARWDHNFSDRDRLYTLFTYDHDTQQESDNGFSGAAGTGAGNGQRTSQNYVVDWTRVFSPTAVANVRLSFGRFTAFFPESSCPSCLTAASLGIQLPQSPSAVPGTPPHIDAGFYSSVIGNTVQWSTQNQLDLTPSMTLTRGNHILHFGAEFTEAALGQSAPGRASGSLGFTRGWTQQFPGVATGYSDGSPIADLLLGLPSTGYIDSSSGTYRRWPYVAGYIQDNWRIKPNFTLSMGLRYDVQVPFTELNGRLDSGFDFTAVNPDSAAIIANWKADKAAWDPQHPNAPYPNPPSQILGGLTFPTSAHARAFKTDWTDVQPRLGVAWNFAPKTVFRAGAGIFYRTATQMGSTYGYDQRTYYKRSLDGGLTPAAGLTGPGSLADPFPYGVAPATGASAGLATNLGNPILFADRNRPIPRTYEYSAGFQRELPGLLLLEADYSGSQTVHDGVPLTLNPSALTAHIASASQLRYMDTLVPNPLVGSGVPVNSVLGAAGNISIAALLRPYPEFDQITLTNGAFGHDRYDSLQLKLEKRVLDIAPAGIFSFVFAYTFSKSFSADHLLNPSDLTEKPIRELSPGDRPQSIGLAGTWDMPFGWGRRYFSHANAITAALINSWSMDWVYLYQSGTPVTEPDAVFSCSSFKAPGGQNAQHWFNNDRDCWTARPLWSYRTTPDRFNNIRTPTAGQLNLSVEKTIWLSDRFSMQLRGEAYNLTNTPIFQAPVTDITDPRFGQLPLTQENFPRFLQVALRISF
jgi:hypothetical protein